MLVCMRVKISGASTNPPRIKVKLAASNTNFLLIICLEVLIQSKEAEDDATIHLTRRQKSNKLEHQCKQTAEGRESFYCSKPAAQSGH